VLGPTECHRQLTPKSVVDGGWTGPAAVLAVADV
jgi:hypothetical protein